MISARILTTEILGCKYCHSVSKRKYFHSMAVSSQDDESFLEDPTSVSSLRLDVTFRGFCSTRETYDFAQTFLGVVHMQIGPNGIGDDTGVNVMWAHPCYQDIHRLYGFRKCTSESRQVPALLEEVRYVRFLILRSSRPRKPRRLRYRRAWIDLVSHIVSSICRSIAAGFASVGPFSSW